MCLFHLTEKASKELYNGLKRNYFLLYRNMIIMIKLSRTSKNSGEPFCFANTKKIVIEKSV